VLAEHFEEQAGRGLQLPVALRLPGITLKNQSGDACNFTKAALREFCGVQARQYVFQQMVDGEQAAGLW
jgi:hypothetical protein